MFFVSSNSNLYRLFYSRYVVNSTYTEPHDNQALVYDRKENLDLSLHNQFDYAGLSGNNSLIHYMNNNGSSMYGPVPPDMHMNSIVSSNGSVGAQFVITKPRAPRRNSLAGKWNKEEDEQLKIIVQEHGAKNWKKVCNRLFSFLVLFYYSTNGAPRLLRYWERQERMCSACIGGIKC